MSKGYIERAEFEYVILNEDVEIAKHGCKDYESYINGANQFRFQMRNAIQKAPTADVVEVKHGRWIPFLDGDSIMPERYYRCSKCGRVEEQKEPYCHCGAKMDGECREG